MPSRSLIRVFGFPDYITVNTIDAGKGATLAIWGRPRFGAFDLGTNRKRIVRWLKRLDKTRK